MLDAVLGTDHDMNRHEDLWRMDKEEPDREARQRQPVQVQVLRALHDYRYYNILVSCRGFNTFVLLDRFQDDR